MPPIPPSSASPATPASTPEPPPIAQTEPIFDITEIQGKVKNIYPGDGDPAIVSADKLYLYDFVTGYIVTELALPVTDISFIQPTKNGYVIVGENSKASNGGDMTASKDSRGTHCIFYDENLENLSAISLNSIHENGHSVLFSNPIAVSKNGNSIAFSTSNGLF